MPNYTMGLGLFVGRLLGLVVGLGFFDFLKEVKMKWLVLVGLCSFSLGAVEFGGLTGRIVNKSTGKPIFCANVVLRGTPPR